MNLDQGTLDSIKTASPTPSALLVVDTNFLLRDLTLVQSVQAWHTKFRHVIVIPWTVMQERMYRYTAGAYYSGRAQVEQAEHQGEINWYFGERSDSLGSGGVAVRQWECHRGKE
jgi:hypothetical protein